MARSVCNFSWMALGACALGLCFSPNGHANVLQKKYGLGLMVGVPQLAGLEVKFAPVSPLDLGFTIGSAPINKILNSLVKVSAIPVSTAASDTYQLYPSVTYSTLSASLYARYYPGQDSGWYFQGGASYLVFSATVNGDMKNETQGTTVPGAITGTASIKQLLISAGGGYQWALSDRLYLDLSAGVSVHLSPSTSVNLGGLASIALPSAPDQSQAFNSTVASFQSQLEQGAQSYYSSVPVSPVVEIAFGWAF